jgi:hypothetical protein
MLGHVSAFLQQVSKTGSSCGLEELLQSGELFTDALFVLSRENLLACTILKVVITKGAPLSKQTRAGLLQIQAPPRGPLGDQLAQVLARLAVREWPKVVLTEFPPFCRSDALREVRIAFPKAALLQEQAQQCVMQWNGADWRLLRQAAKCGAVIPFERLKQAPSLELLRLFAAAQDEDWAGFRENVAKLASQHCVAHSRLSARVLRRSCVIPACAQGALFMLQHACEKDGGDLWGWAFERAPRDCVALLLGNQNQRVIATALLHSDTEELRQLVSPWQLLTRLLNNEKNEAAVRLLARWAAEVPANEHLRLVAWLLARPSPSAGVALAAVVTDARFSGPRRPEYRNTFMFFFLFLRSFFFQKVCAVGCGVA